VTWCVCASAVISHSARRAGLIRFTLCPLDLKVVPARALPALQALVEQEEVSGAVGHEEEGSLEDNAEREQSAYQVAAGASLATVRHPTHVGEGVEAQDTSGLGAGAAEEEEAEACVHVDASCSSGKTSRAISTGVQLLGNSQLSPAGADKILDALKESGAQGDAGDDVNVAPLFSGDPAVQGEVDDCLDAAMTAPSGTTGVLRRCGGEMDGKDEAERASKGLADEGSGRTDDFEGMEGEEGEPKSDGLARDLPEGDGTGTKAARMKDVNGVLMDIGRLAKTDLSSSPDTRVWQIKKHIMAKLAPNLPPSNLVLLCRGIPLRDDTKLHLVKSLIWPHNSPFDLVLRFAYRRPY
jgi:hypothetical protein